MVLVIALYTGVPLKHKLQMQNKCTLNTLELRDAKNKKKKKKNGEEKNFNLKMLS